MGAREAKAIGLIDDYFGGGTDAFEGAIMEKAKQLAAGRSLAAST